MALLLAVAGVGEPLHIKHQGCSGIIDLPLHLLSGNYVLYHKADTLSAEGSDSLD